MGASSGAARVLEGEWLPPRLADLEDPPTRLYLHGELPRGPAVAIVGTRRFSREGIAFTRGFAAELAAQGVAILSGGAEGIDTAAHEGALDAGGVTVVVAPAALDKPYPSENKELFERIVASGGAYLSLFPDGTPATRTIFFARNACLAALSHALVVAETPVSGGTKNAAKWARQLGRPVFVVPHSPWNWNGAGCVQELRLGGIALHGPTDVLNLLRASGLRGLPALPPPGGAGVHGTSDAVQVPLPLPEPGMDPVLEALRSGANHADEIAEQTGLSLGEVQQRLLTLALSGVLVPGPWGSLKLITS